MKKLMMIGAVAASTVAFGAEASYLAQVYDASLTLKTGVCKDGKATKATVKYYEAYLGKDNAPFDKGQEMSFRKQSTRKITGVIWGCDCETIAFPAWRAYRSTAGWNLGGYAFWDQAANNYFVLPNTVFGWLCLNRITDSFKSVEGSWQLVNNLDPQWMFMTGAGFGKASIAKLPCRSIVSKISGSFAGVRWPGQDDLVSDCAYCGIGNCNVRPFCEICRIWTRNSQLTAAYGSWSIKFNKTAANKLKKYPNISDSRVYKFKKAGDLQTVLSRMEAFVRRFGQLGGFPGIAMGSRAVIAPLVVRLAYLYGIAPSAVTLGAGPVVAVNVSALAGDVDAEEITDEETDAVQGYKYTFDLSSYDADMTPAEYAELYENADALKQVEDCYLNILGYERMSDKIAAADDEDDEDEALDYDDEDDDWDDEDEYIGAVDEWYPGRCKSCFGDYEEDTDRDFFLGIIRLVDRLVGDAS